MFKNHALETDNMTKDIDNMTKDIKIPCFDEQARWFISRFDSWRASIATRCSLVLSADALLLAAHTFLLDKAITQHWLHPLPLPNPLFAVLLGAGMLSLLISLYYATTGIANVWKPSRQMFGDGMPDRLLYHPSDMVNTCKSFAEFQGKFSTLSVEDTHSAFWAELWSLAQMHHYRYQRLRRAIVFLVVALPLFLCSIFLVLLRYVLT